MRKAVYRCLSVPLLCCLAAFLWICAASASEEPLLNGFLRDDENGISLTCWYESETDAEHVESVLCAVYDGNGMLMTVADLEPKTGRQTTVVPCDTAMVDHVKLLTMDDAQKPLRPARTLKLTAASSDTPQYMTGYPAVSENTVSVSGSAMTRVKVKADRSCRLYWALYKQNAGYATAARFASNDLPGSEKHGYLILSVGQENMITLTNLEDQTDYDLDLWLTNPNFEPKTYITRLSFTTVDGTAPVFLSGPEVSTAAERSVSLKYTLNENATFYWVVVEGGNRFPNPPTGGGTITKDYAIKQVISGNGGVSHGKATVRANAANSFTVSYLTPQKSYDIWYVAQDSAGNYSEFRTGTPDSTAAGTNPRGVCMLTAYTLDNQPPEVTLESTNYPDGHPETPYADSSLRLIFSEGIRRFSTGEVLSDLYDAVTAAGSANTREAARETLAAFLRKTVVLYSGSGTSFSPVAERATGEEDEWVIDYRNAVVTWEDENLVLTFPATDDTAEDSALHLMGGQSYYFLLQDLSDLSENLNRISSLKTDTLTTMPAQILFEEINLNSANYPSGVSAVDLAFSATPMAISRVSGSTAWDLLFWVDTTSSFEVYRRSRLATSAVYDQPWARVQSPQGLGGQGSVIVPLTASGQMAGQSMHIHFCQYDSGNIPELGTLEDGRVYEYAVRFLEVDGDSERGLWDAEINFGVTAVAASPSALLNLAANLTYARLEAAKSAGTVQEISSPSPFRMTRLFYATVPPTFFSGSPTFTPTDTTVEMWLQMTRPGTVHYLVAPVGAVTTQDKNGRTVDWSRYLEIPESGSDTGKIPFSLTRPSWSNIVNQLLDGANGAKAGAAEVGSRGTSVTLTGLKSKTNYFAYFILQGSGSNYSTSAQLYRFTTEDAAPPVVQMTLKGTVATLSANQSAMTDYVVVDTADSVLNRLLKDAFWNNAPSGGTAPPSASLQVDSVLEAMCIDTGSGSIFDRFASTTYREQIAAYIRQSIADGTVIVGARRGVSVLPATPITIDASALNLVEGHRYAVVTVTRAVEGDVDIFRAVSPVIPPDSTPPLITAIREELAMDGATSLEQITCSGSVTLTFDSDLYYLTNGVLKAVDRGPSYYSRRSDSFISLTGIGTSSASSRMAIASGQVAQVNQNTSTIVLTLTNAMSGDHMTFPTQLCDEYGNLHNFALDVTLEVKTVQTGVDPATNRPIVIHQPSITVSKTWDGRTAES